jgi:hypothetical protein
MQPTRSAFRMMVAAERLHRAPPISGERRCEPTPDVRIARTAEVNEPNLAEKARRKPFLGVARHKQHPAAPGRCHWKQQAAARRESIKP